MKWFSPEDYLHPDIGLRNRSDKDSLLSEVSAGDWRDAFKNYSELLLYPY